MQKSKLTTIIIVIVTLVLAGIAVFTAVRLYQTRSMKVAPNAPESNPKADSISCPVGKIPNPVYSNDPAGGFPACTLAANAPCCVNDPATNSTTAPTSFCSQVTGTCLNSNNQCVSYTDGCQRLALCKTPVTTCTLTQTTPTPVSNLCLPKAYFDIVLTDANGDNSGVCRPTSITFGSNGLSCNNTGNITCDQYLSQLTQQSGVNKTGGCYDTVTACQNPDGKAASFRFFFNGTKCISTNHRYWTSGTGANNDIDADDPNHRTCVTNLGLAGVAKKVCYTTKSACQTDNTLPTPTATATARPTATPVDVPNTCLLEFSITSSTPTATATATSVATATPTATATSTSVATATPTATATSVAQCNNSCTSNSNCPSGLICYITSGSTSGSCRNTQCLSETDCSCNTTIASTPTPTNIASNSNPTNTPEQPQLPDAGTSWPTVFGSIFGIVVLLGSLLLAF